MVVVVTVVEIYPVKLKLQGSLIDLGLVLSFYHSLPFCRSWDSI